MPKIMIEYPRSVSVSDVFLYVKELLQWLKARGKGGYGELQGYCWVFPDDIELTMPAPTDEGETRFELRQGSTPPLAVMLMNGIAKEKDESVRLNGGLPDQPVHRVRSERV